MKTSPLVVSLAVALWLALTFATRSSVAGDNSPATLTTIVREALPRLGHRNWIVVADMAYPAQSGPGIKTIYVGGPHAEAIEATLAAIDAAPHVRGEVLVDRELSAVAEADAPGISAFRKTLEGMLKERPVDHRLHEQIIQDLDTAAKTFEVLILKTDMTIPYTSVFIRLDCGYWSADAERRLRESLASP